MKSSIVGWWESLVASRPGAHIVLWGVRLLSELCLFRWDWYLPLSLSLCGPISPPPGLHPRFFQNDSALYFQKPKKDSLLFSQNVPRGFFRKKTIALWLQPKSMSGENSVCPYYEDWKDQAIGAQSLFSTPLGGWGGGGTELFCIFLKGLPYRKTKLYNF